MSYVTRRTPEADLTFTQPPVEDAASISSSAGGCREERSLSSRRVENSLNNTAHERTLKADRAAAALVRARYALSHVLATTAGAPRRCDWIGGCSRSIFKFVRFMMCRGTHRLGETQASRAHVFDLWQAAFGAAPGSLSC